MREKELIARLNNIGIALTSETRLDRLLELVVKEARNFTNAEGGSLYLKKDDGLHFLVAQNEVIDKIRKEPFKSHILPLDRRSIAGFVSLEGKVLNIEDVYKLCDVPYSFNREFDVMYNYRSKSMLVVPMKERDGEVIGALQLVNARDENGNVIPFDPIYEQLIASLASQATVAISNAILIEEIKKLLKSLVEYTATAIDARSPHTAGHSRRVATYSLNIARAINEENRPPFDKIEFSEDDLEELYFSAWLHDVGKIGVREAVLDKSRRLSTQKMDEIRTRFKLIKLCASLKGDKKTLSVLPSYLAFIEKLSKRSFITEEELNFLKEIRRKRVTLPWGEEISYIKDDEFENLSIPKGNLTKKEYEEIKSHVIHTLRIVGKIPFPKNLKNVPTFAACHHELLDGTGYPKGLTAKDIPLQTRIITVADIFDALTAKDRPYKKSVPLNKALEILKEEAEKGKLDRDIVWIFEKRKCYEGVK